MAARTSGWPALSHWNPRSQRNPSMTSVPTRPPTRADRSRTRTCRPDSSNARAQASPATPAPITATSVASMGGEYRLVRESAHTGRAATRLGMDHTVRRGTEMARLLRFRPGRTPRCAVDAALRLRDRQQRVDVDQVRARRRTPAPSRRRRPARTGRRTRAGAGRGCRRTSARAAARRGRRAAGSPGGRPAPRDPPCRPRTRRRSTRCW